MMKPNSIKYFIIGGIGGCFAVAIQLYLGKMDYKDDLRSATYLDAKSVPFMPGCDAAKNIKTATIFSQAPLISPICAPRNHCIKSFKMFRHYKLFNETEWGGRGGGTSIWCRVNNDAIDISCYRSGECHEIKGIADAFPRG